MVFSCGLSVVLFAGFGCGCFDGLFCGFWFGCADAVLAVCFVLVGCVGGFWFVGAFHVGVLGGWLCVWGCGCLLGGCVVGCCVSVLVR